MAILKSKTPYTDQYGSGLSLKFESENGVYPTKRKNDHKDYVWLSGLQIGDEVSLVKNEQGKGYLIKKIEEQTFTNATIAQKNIIPQDTIKQKAALMAQCYNEIHALLPTLQEENKRAMAVSLFIQAGK